MATKEEWVKLFESTMGRKPTAEEYAQAMATDFNPEVIAEMAGHQASPAPAQEAAGLTPRDQWAQLFETTMGRKPSAQEFMQAKEAGFDLSQFAAPAAPQAPAAEVTQAPADQPDFVAPAQAQQAQEQAQMVADAANSQAPQTEAKGPVQEPAPQANPAEAAPQAGQDQGFQQPADFNQQPNPAAVNPQAEQMQGFQQAPGFNQQANPAQMGFPPAGNHQAKNSSLMTMILPIVSLVLAVLFAGLSFTPFNWLFVGLAFLNLVFAIILLIVNLKGKKVLSIIASAVALLAIFVSLIGAIASQHSASSAPASDSKKEAPKVAKSKIKDDSTDVEDYMDSNAKFDWKESDISDVRVEKDTVADVISEHGKAQEAEISKDTLYLRYEKGDSTSDDRQYVNVSFTKQYDGTWTVEYVSGQFPADDIETSGESYKSDWTKADFDALKEGDYETGAGGTKWTDIKDKHGKPSQAYYTIDKFDEGDVTKTLRVQYTDYDATGDKATSVYLDFKAEDGGSYALSHKYGSGAGITDDTDDE